MTKEVFFSEMCICCGNDKYSVTCRVYHGTLNITCGESGKIWVEVCLPVTSDNFLSLCTLGISFDDGMAEGYSERIYHFYIDYNKIETILITKVEESYYEDGKKHILSSLSSENF